MNEITKTAKEKIKTMKCEDVVVVWGGANGMSRNNMKEYNHIQIFTSIHNYSCY